MYKIFINEKPFIIAHEDVHDERFAGCKRVKYDPAKLVEHIKECESMRSKGIIMISDDADLTFKDFYTHFVVIEASGGIVFNKLNELLLIKRLGKWDLPKGKIDSGEGNEEAAVREVMEECGIDGLSVEQQLPDTYHTYKMHNHRFLKITHWYKMHTSFDRELVPQLEEHITEAKWFNWKNLDPDELDTYLSIRELLHTIR